MIAGIFRIFQFIRDSFNVLSCGPHQHQTIQILLLILKYDIIEVRLISIVLVVPFLFFYNRLYLRRLKGKKIKLIKELDKLEELLKT